MLLRITRGALMLRSLHDKDTRESGSLSLLLDRSGKLLPSLCSSSTKIVGDFSPGAFESTLQGGLNHVILLTLLKCGALTRGMKAASLTGVRSEKISCTFAAVKELSSAPAKVVDATTGCWKPSKRPVISQLACVPLDQIGSRMTLLPPMAGGAEMEQREEAAEAEA